MKRPTAEACILLCVLLFLALSGLYISHRSVPALEAFGLQLTGLDTKLNSLRAALDFQHQVISARLDDGEERLALIQRALRIDT
jgi:hypothetical protein